MARSVLVTGGAGYIGSHIVLDLLAHGHAPVVLDNLSTGERRLVPDGVPLVVADAADIDRCRRTIAEHGIADVIHCAGSLNVEESVTDPIKYWRNNVGASIALVEACAAACVRRLVFSSTAAVYGNAEAQPVTEEHEARPISPYGTTKRAIELMLTDVCAATGLMAAALRYFNVAGADPAGRSGASAHARPSLIRVVCRALLGEDPRVEVYGSDYDTPDGTAVRDYIHVSDLAHAHTIVLDALEADAEAEACHGDMRILNCGYGRGASVREVVAAGMRVAGARIDLVESSRRPGDIGCMVADSSRLRAGYAWQPRYDDLDRIIADTLRWERAAVPAE
jgi:UDP-glucose 4-epimerase